MKKFWKTDKEELKQEIIEQIFQRDINAVDDNGYTLLLRVAASGFHTLLSLLFTVKTLDVNLTDKDGRTALMLACKNGHVETVRRLLCDPRIDVNLEFRSEGTSCSGIRPHQTKPVEKSLLGCHPTHLKIIIFRIFVVD